MEHTPGPWKIVDYKREPPRDGDFVGRIDGPNA